ncbi:hypothetical protein [Leptospira meyeri]|uniref:hypothetical protein n=1 Tax=Leptospira meyeri TaxID=29508 RepID=UPI000F64711D|nr:hypothetical protein [Leptospira meyeri]
MKTFKQPKNRVSILKILNFILCLIIFSSCIKESNEIKKALNDNSEWPYGWGYFDENGIKIVPSNCFNIKKCKFLFLPLRGRKVYPPTLSNANCKTNKQNARENIHLAIWNMIIENNICTTGGNCSTDNLSVSRIKSIIPKITKYEVLECKQFNSVIDDSFCDCLIYFNFPDGENQLDQLINNSKWPNKI